MDEYTKNKELFLAQKQAEKDAYLNGVRDALDQLFLLHAGTIAGGVLRYGERPGSQSAAGA